jgi:DegV family protein with EDD domain
LEGLVIKIVTDAEANLPPELMQRYDITTIPLWLHFGEYESYQEGISITREAFYERQATATEFPKTSQASVGQFVELYRPIVEAGHEIVSIHLSCELSGTYQSALGAAEQFPGAKISVVDSRQATGAQSFMVWHAAEWAEAGLSREEIVARLKPMSKRIHAFFMVDSLEHLRRGGRLGGAAAFFGTLLQVKPILTLKDGKIDACDKARTRKRALARLKELTVDAGRGHRNTDVAVVHTQCPQDAEALLEELVAALKPQRAMVDWVGPGIGAHMGPGMIGAAVHHYED